MSLIKSRFFCVVLKDAENITDDTFSLDVSRAIVATLKSIENYGTP